MKIACFNIRIGVNRQELIDPKQVVFYKQVYEQFDQGAPSDVKYISPDYSYPITNSDIIYFNSASNYKCLKWMGGFIEDKNDSQDIISIIIDFGEFPVVVRNSAYDSIIQYFKDKSEKDQAVFLIFIQDEIPGIHGKIRDEIYSIVENSSRKIVFCGSGNEVMVFSDDPNGNYGKESNFPEFDENKKTCYGDPTQKLNINCIRRLGHFKDEDLELTHIGCRNYSYHFHSNAIEFTSLLKGWKNLQGKNVDCIIYDCRANAPFSQAINSLNASYDVKIERLEDVLSDYNIQNELKNKKCIALALDVVSKGDRLKEIHLKLKERGVNTCGEIVTAINKSGQAQTQITNLDGQVFNIYGFISKPRDEEKEGCEQCELNIPFTNEESESSGQITTYEMYLMVNHCGWEPEHRQEIPHSGVKPLEFVPAYKYMIPEFGDWLSYRFYSKLKSTSMPKQTIIIHPDEPDATSLVQQYQRHESGIISIAVDRDFITKAISKGWDFLFESEESELKSQLEYCAKVKMTAIIIDIFKVSGSTTGSLLELLDRFNIPVTAQMNINDFLPSSKIKFENLINYSLYDWPHSRKSA